MTDRTNTEPTDYSKLCDDFGPQTNDEICQELRVLFLFQFICLFICLSVSVYLHLSVCLSLCYRYSFLSAPLHVFYSLVSTSKFLHPVLSRFLLPTPHFILLSLTHIPSLFSHSLHLSPILYILHFTTISITTSPLSSSLQKDDRVCAQLFCFDSSSGYCVSFRPAAEGSDCGNGKICINGRCEYDHGNSISDFDINR